MQADDQQELTVGNPMTAITKERAREEEIGAMHMKKCIISKRYRPPKSKNTKSKVAPNASLRSVGYELSESPKIVTLVPVVAEIEKH